MRLLLVAFLLIFLTGCPAVPYKEPPTEIKNQEWERSSAKITLPLNIAAAYFGSIATHEGGHALVAAGYGADSIQVDVLPTRHDGMIHLGFTEAYFHHPINSTQDFLGDISGPNAAFAGQIAGRELLKTGYIPLALQPTLQWYTVGCKVQFYGEVLLGICRVKTADFGKQPAWAPLAFGVGGLLYDIWDIGFCDDPQRYFKVLVGESFYYRPEEQKRWYAYMGPTKGGGQFALVYPF